MKIMQRLLPLLLLLALVFIAGTSNNEKNTCPIGEISSGHDFLVFGDLNDISVSACGYESDELLLEADQAEIQSTEFGIRVKPLVRTRTTLRLFLKKGKKLLVSKDFRVVSKPKPLISLGANPGPFISKGELMSVTYVRAGMGASIWGVDSSKVDSFVLVYAPPQVWNVNGSRIPKGMQGAFANANQGDWISLARVYASGYQHVWAIQGPTLEVK